MDQLPQAVAGLNFVVEVQCPHCRTLNKYQQLSAAHSNVRSFLNKPDKPADWSTVAKCQACDRQYRIVKTVFV